VKKCPYCGRESADGAVRCSECGTSFVPPTDEPAKLPEGWTRPAPSKRAKLNLLGVAWSIALLAMLPNKGVKPEVGTGVVGMALLLADFP
jgi:hypothetical protein